MDVIRVAAERHFVSSSRALVDIPTRFRTLVFSCAASSVISVSVLAARLLFREVRVEDERELRRVRARSG